MSIVKLLVFPISKQLMKKSKLKWKTYDFEPQVEVSVTRGMFLRKRYGLTSVKYITKMHELRINSYQRPKPIHTKQI